MKTYRLQYGQQINRNVLVIIGIMALLQALPALAQVPQEPAAIDWLTLLMGLFGGLAMFLFGMEQMSDGLKGAAGDTLKDVLARLRNNFV